MINFAHGEVFMIGAYIGWGVLASLIDWRSAGCIRSGSLPVMLAAGHGCCAAGSAWRWSASPIGRSISRGATRLGPLISAVGASIFLQNAVMLTQGARMKVYMTNLVFPRTWRVQHRRRQRLGHW